MTHAVGLNMDYFRTVQKLQYTLKLLTSFTLGSPIYSVNHTNINTCSLNRHGYLKSISKAKFTPQVFMLRSDFFFFKRLMFLSGCFH